MVAKLAKKRHRLIQITWLLALIIEGLELGELDDDVLAAAAASGRTRGHEIEREITAAAPANARAALHIISGLRGWGGGQTTP